jgi:hypothetical protein
MGAGRGRSRFRSHVPSEPDRLQLLIKRRTEEAKAGRKSTSTANFYKAKAGHWTRLLESNAAGNYVPFPLAKLHARDVDGYISTRRAEGASESTISKELITLRAALKLAKRAGIWKGDIMEIPANAPALKGARPTTCDAPAPRGYALKARRLT